MLVVVFFFWQIVMELKAYKKYRKKIRKASGRNVIRAVCVYRAAWQKRTITMISCGQSLWLDEAKWLTQIESRCNGNKFEFEHPAVSGRSIYKK